MDLNDFLVAFVISILKENSNLMRSNKNKCMRFAGTTWEGEQELNQHPNVVKADDETDSGYFERLGANTELFFERCFTAWGTYCAKNPWLILFLGFCFVCAMGHGIKYLKITTDPVEIWAAPNSRSRIEREFFDSNFEPFYRIEQVRKMTYNIIYY